MQKQGYTFPVLAAFSIPERMRQLVPRTWIIDPNGNWLWVKNGYDESQAYGDFEKEMLEQIGKAKAVAIAGFAVPRLRSCEIACLVQKTGLYFTSPTSFAGQ